MNVLLIEDEDPKLLSILRFLNEIDLSIVIVTARSVKSGLSRLKEALPDILLLDISLPTFDITGEEPGGRPQGFGGIEIIRYLDSLDIAIPVIVVSAYEAFSKDGVNIDLKALALELETDYPELIRGVVYFNPIHGGWSEDLAKLIELCK